VRILSVSGRTAWFSYFLIINLTYKYLRRKGFMVVDSSISLYSLIYHSACRARHRP
jgi:hypothetical protein